MRHLVSIGLVVVACNATPTITEVPASATSVRRAPDWLRPSSIHGGPIQQVAITDQGDAAVSADSLGEVRLWPTLDGTRAPVPLALARPRTLAIARAGDELLVASVDEAGTASLERLSRDGALRGTATLASDPAVVQIAAIDGGVLAVRADQTIERYDAAGALRGRLAADPGERFGELAVRRGGAAVLVIAADAPLLDFPPDEPRIRGATSVRFVVLGDDLVRGGIGWGPRLALPGAVQPHALALAPSHRRIALQAGVGAQMHVFDVVGSLHEHGTGVLVTSGELTLGFIDDDHVAAIGSTITWWPASTEAPPPIPSMAEADIDSHDGAPTGALSSQGGAVGDGVAVGGEEIALALATPQRVRYLGSEDDQAAELSPAGGGFALVTRAALALVLDARLGWLRETKLTAETSSYYVMVWLDERRVVLGRAVDGGVAVVLVDTGDASAEVTLGTFPRLDGLDYDRRSRVIAVIETTTVHRFSLDAALRRPTKLPELVAPVRIHRLRLLDPATHDGLVAVGSGVSMGYVWQHLEWHDGSGSAIAATKPVTETGAVEAIDRDGAIYIARDALVVERRGQITPFWAESPTLVEPSDDGRFVATMAGPTVAMHDAHGRVLWQRTVWEVSQLVFSTDSHRLVVQAAGGLLELDAATGERLASACGFRFGLHDELPSMSIRATPTVCED